MFMTVSIVVFDCLIITHLVIGLSNLSFRLKKILKCLSQKYSSFLSSLQTNSPYLFLNLQHESETLLLLKTIILNLLSFPLIIYLNAPNHQNNQLIKFIILMFPILSVLKVVTKFVCQDLIVTVLILKILIFMNLFFIITLNKC